MTVIKFLSKIKRIVVDDAVLGVNGSKVFLKAEADKKIILALQYFLKNLM